MVLFYLFDYSPVCTEGLCNFAESEWLTFTPGLDVVGISTDSAFAHRRMIQVNDLPFPLLSDHDGTVSERYDVLYETLEDHPRVSRRAVFLIDADRTIRYAWEADPWTEDPDIRAVHGAVTELDGLDLSSPSA